MTDLQIHTEWQVRSYLGEWRALKIRVGSTDVTGDACLGKQVLWQAWRTKGPPNCADATKLHEKADETGHSKLGGLGLRPCYLPSN